jgi:hypothetical protein
MLTEVVGAVISSIVVAIIFEIWAKRKALMGMLFRSDRAAGTEALDVEREPVEAEFASDSAVVPPGRLDPDQVMPGTDEVGEVRPGDSVFVARGEVEAERGVAGALGRGSVAPETRGCTCSGLMKSAIRLFLASLVGFIIGGLVAGVLEAEGAGEIALGSWLAFALIMLPTVGLWFLLYNFGPLKDRRI